MRTTTFSIRLIKFVYSSSKKLGIIIVQMSVYACLPTKFLGKIYFFTFVLLPFSVCWFFPAVFFSANVPFPRKISRFIDKLFLERTFFQCSLFLFHRFFRWVRCHRSQLCSFTCRADRHMPSTSPILLWKKQKACVPCRADRATSTEK